MVISGTRVRLREKRLSDARNDYEWQTDPELVEMDAAPLLRMPFPQYLLEYTNEMRYGSAASHRFAVETNDGRHIGNCTCYNINPLDGEAELGIMIGDRDYWDSGYGTDAVITLVNFIFRKKHQLIKLL